MRFSGGQATIDRRNIERSGLKVSGTEVARMISLWKAPHWGTAQRLLKEGFSPNDYPGFTGEIPDGRAYFALQIELANEYAACYGDGIIEVRLSQSDYERHFQRFDMPYQDTGLSQIVIPKEFLPLLNALTIERVFHDA